MRFLARSRPTSSVAVLVLCVSGVALAQDDAARITVDFKNAPIREVLSELARQFPGLRYTIPDDVRGEVTVGLRDISLPAALRLVLGSIGASYRLEDGTYVVERQPRPVSRPLPPTSARPPVTRTPPAARAAPLGMVSSAPAAADEDEEEDLVVRALRIKRADPVDVAIVFGGTVVSSRMGQLAGYGGGGYGGFGGGYGGYGGYGGGGYGGLGGFGGGYGGYGGGYGGFGGFGGGLGGWGGGYGGYGGGGYGGFGRGGFGGFGGGWGGRGGGWGW